ncbi:MAG: hypothetical protein JWO42_1391 [Chloroflexi bacterium]|nr:hypothetical protein [Chloroflexota bacterium]
MVGSGKWFWRVRGGPRQPSSREYRSMICPSRYPIGYRGMSKAEAGGPDYRSLWLSPKTERLANNRAGDWVPSNLLYRPAVNNTG